MTDQIQLLGISNAIVDVLTHVDHEFLERIGAEPGSMTLIDKERAKDIYNMMGPATEMSGGSVANTIAGFANLGGAAAYIGKVRDDQLGRIFNHDMRSLGVDIRLPRAADGAPTARSHVLITKDGQRTMQTYLGACLELGLVDISAKSRPDRGLCLGYRRGPGAGSQGYRHCPPQRHGCRLVTVGFILRRAPPRLFRSVRAGWCRYRGRR